MCVRRNMLRFGNPRFPVQARLVLVQLAARGDLALRTTSMQATVALHVRIFTHRYLHTPCFSAASRLEAFFSLFKLRKTLLRHQLSVLLHTVISALYSYDSNKSRYHTEHIGAHVLFSSVPNMKPLILALLPRDTSNDSSEACLGIKVMHGGWKLAALT